MKPIVLAFAAALLVAATSVHAQQAPATAQPQPDVAAAAAVQAAQTCRDNAGRQIPCPTSVKKVAPNHTPIILGAVGAAAVVGALSSGGGGDKPAPPPSKPSSP